MIRLRTIAIITIIGGTSASVLAALGSLWLSSDALERRSVEVAGSISFLVLECQPGDLLSVQG